MASHDEAPARLSARRTQHGDERAAAPVRASRQVSPVQLLQRVLGNTRLAQMRAVQRRAGGQVPGWIRSDLGLPASEPQASVQQADDAPTQVHVPGGGQALPAEMRSRAESHLGVGLDDTRLVHADEACRSVDALAFCAQGDGGGHTIGVSSQIDLDSREGQFTLAHELSHVAQQKLGRTSALDGLGGDEGVRDTLEHEADRDAEAILTSRAPERAPGATP